MLDPVLLYLDPGTGATLVQLALAGTAGIAGLTKLRMNKLRRKTKTQTEPAEEILNAEEMVEEATSSE
ncbi:MAG: hypothetical protein GY788_30910 [bacterium]|nr:hypothetical protein [bacterium]